jgi:hypothetical protein
VAAATEDLREFARLLGESTGYIHEVNVDPMPESWSIGARPRASTPRIIQP